MSSYVQRGRWMKLFDKKSQWSTSSQGYIIASSIFDKYASNECLLISSKYWKKVYIHPRVVEHLLGRSWHEWNVHHYQKQWRYLGLFNDRIEKHLRGGDRFIIIGVIDDRARGSCLRRASARVSNPWMAARTIHQHCKSIRLNAISLGKKRWQACQLISSRFDDHPRYLSILAELIKINDKKFLSRRGSYLSNWLYYNILDCGGEISRDCY